MVTILFTRRRAHRRQNKRRKGFPVFPRQFHSLTLSRACRGKVVRSTDYIETGRLRYNFTACITIPFSSNPIYTLLPCLPLMSDR